MMMHLHDANATVIDLRHNNGQHLGVLVLDRTDEAGIRSLTPEGQTLLAFMRRWDGPGRTRPIGNANEEARHALTLE